MLKAVSTTDNSPLDLFQASLETARLGEPLPEQLKSYISEIIREAAIIQSGEHDLARVQAASIYFFSSVSSDTKLASFINAIQGNGLSAEVANDILKAMTPA